MRATALSYYGTEAVETLMSGLTMARAVPGAIASKLDEGPFWFHVELPGKRVATLDPVTHEGSGRRGDNLSGVPQIHRSLKNTARRPVGNAA
jgi:hypothetical protein